MTLNNPIHQKLFIHYFTPPALLKALNCEDEITCKVIADYITEEFPLMYTRLVRYVAVSRIPYSSIQGAYKQFGARFVQDILNLIDYNSVDIPFVIGNMSKVQNITHLKVFDYELIKCYFLYEKYSILHTTAKSTIISAIQALDERKTREILLNHFDKFKAVVIKEAVGDEVGAEYIIEEISRQLSNVYEQLSLFG